MHLPNKLEIVVPRFISNKDNPPLLAALVYEINVYRHEKLVNMYWVTQKSPQIYIANHATFPIRIRKFTVQICGNFWVTQYGKVKKLGYNQGLHNRIRVFFKDMIRFLLEGRIRFVLKLDPGQIHPDPQPSLDISR